MFQLLALAHENQTLVEPSELRLPHFSTKKRPLSSKCADLEIMGGNWVKMQEILDAM